jgi:tetratricopeptide (TPR) repeat protein
MTIGLALIVRDERDTLPGLLASIEGAFDQVVLVDTGSQDGTADVFREWAAAETERQDRFSSRVASFEWNGSFAAARSYADSLLTTDWKAWADADDEIHGADRLRGLAESAPADVAAFRMGYSTGQSATGQPLAYVRRERLVRAGRGAWQGRVHEVLAVNGGVVDVPPGEVEWVHRRDFRADPRAGLLRNLSLLEDWLRVEPSNPRVHELLGESYAAAGRHEEALDAYGRHLELAQPTWGPGRARLSRKMALSLMSLGRPQEALELAREALLAVPSWTDSYLTMAEAKLALGEPLEALEWARTALRLGPPDTGMVVSPLDYSLVPRMLMARALRAAGREDEAREVARQSLAECFDATS